MGTLLKFDGNKRSSDGKSPFSGKAQILIFTGVRYERGLPPMPPTTDDLDTKRRKRKRG